MQGTATFDETISSLLLLLFIFWFYFVVMVGFHCQSNEKFQTIDKLTE